MRVPQTETVKKEKTEVNYSKGSLSSECRGLKETIRETN